MIFVCEKTTLVCSNYTKRIPEMVRFKVFENRLKESQASLIIMGYMA